MKYFEISNWSNECAVKSHNNKIHLNEIHKIHKFIKNEWNKWPQKRVSIPLFTKSYQI